MNRRHLLKSLFGFGVVTPVALDAAPVEKKWGFLNREICELRGLHPTKVKVFLNDVDITHLTLAADDINNYAVVYATDEHGNRYIDSTGRRVEQTIRYGNVRIEFGDQTPGLQEHKFDSATYSLYIDGRQLSKQMTDHLRKIRYDVLTGVGRVR